MVLTFVTAVVTCKTPYFVVLPGCCHVVGFSTEPTLAWDRLIAVCAVILVWHNKFRGLLLPVPLSGVTSYGVYS